MAYHEPRGMAQTEEAGQLRVLSLSSVYPNPSEPTYGIFVRLRLQAIASHGASVRVLAPVPRLDYASGAKNLFSGSRVDYRQMDGEIEVLHPRWSYPPGGGGLNGVFLFAALVRQVRRLRSEFPFHLLDAHFGHPEGVAAWLLSAAVGCPYVVTLRGSETRHAEYGLRRFLMARAVRGAQRVIAVSEPLRQFAISLGASPGRVKTIPNGINVEVFFPRNRAEARRKLRIPIDRAVILSAGYLIERKGHHRVVQCLPALRKKGIQVELWIAGSPGREGAFEPVIMRLVAELGMEQQVRFLGQAPASEMPDLMSAADVLCLASSREGWPNVVNEALACGTPVVATDVGAVPEMLPSEEYGYVTPLNDAAALEQALEKALRKEWDRAAIAAWGQSRSWEQVGREVLEEMRQAAAGGVNHK